MNTILQKSIFFLGIISLLVGCQPSTEGDQAIKELAQARKVETVKVKPVNYQENIFGTGKLSAKEEAKLSFKTGGIIKRIYVSEGQEVRKGQLLAELDLNEIQAKTQQASLGEEQAEITVDNAKLALQLAERDYKNAMGLYQDSVATLEQLENAEVQVNNAKNQLEAAKKGLAFNAQNVEVANFNLKYSKIIAPSNGTILKKMAEANELVGPGKAILRFGSKDKAQVVKVNLTDKDIIHVDLGNEATVSFDAYPNHNFKGIVREMASMADPYTNTYEVEIEVAPDGKKLLSGFIGRVFILTNTHAQLLEIPIDALVRADQNKGEVFVVEDNKAVKTMVGIFKINDNNLLINKGLDPEDEVITSGVGYLEHEDSVLITQKQ